jgi:quercetin dioxygenase-like cupin family protein
MEPVRFADLDLDAVTQDIDPDAEWLAGFPFSPDRPGETTAESAEYTVVYNELAPGKRIGRHADGVDELLFVLAGTVEATVGDERATADAGTLAVVPAETPHSVRNVGDDPAQLVGVFATAPVASTWDTEPAVVDADEE